VLNSEPTTNVTIDLAEVTQLLAGLTMK